VCLYPNPVNYLPLWQVAGGSGVAAGHLRNGVGISPDASLPDCRLAVVCGMMIPVIGIVQISYYAHADRYTYLPQIGLYLLLTWAAADLCAGWRHRRLVLGGGSTVILVALIFCARTQVSYWRNSESLWTHVLACTSDNIIAHDNLGFTFFQQRRLDNAIAHFQKALEIEPTYADAHNHLGLALLQQGRMAEAAAHFQKALEINPDYAEAHNNLGLALLQQGTDGRSDHALPKGTANQTRRRRHSIQPRHALFKKGRVDEAIVHLQKALEINPDYAEAQTTWVLPCSNRDERPKRFTHFQKVLQIKPDDAGIHFNLGCALLQKGRVDDAIAHFQRVLQITPDYADAHLQPGQRSSPKGRVDEAIVHFQRALEIGPDYAESHYNLGSAFFQQGRMVEAIAHYQKALEIRPTTRKPTTTFGLALLQQGRMDEAIAHYQKALEIRPTT